MRITTTILITRPATDVWDLVGRRFAEASVWASSISESVAVGEAGLPDAPCSARECHVAVPGADRLVEHLVAYDDATMSLTYTLAAGMDRVARSARSTWTVVPLGATRSTLRIDAQIDPTPVGRIVAPLLRLYLAAMGRRHADDLRVFAETGAPSARKRRQGRRVDAVVSANAAFTMVSGAALTMGAGWWSTQFDTQHELLLTGLGTCLLVYAVYLAWISGHGVGGRAGRALAALDGAWVVGTGALIASTGAAFTGIGLTAAVATAVVVAAFGWTQWWASANPGVG